jgi:hypothetical protein
LEGIIPASKSLSGRGNTDIDFVLEKYGLPENRKD